MAATSSAATPPRSRPPSIGQPAGAPTHAEVMPKASAENFTVASFLLPPSKRRALLGIYGFARLVDDAGDEAAGDRNALLDWLEADVGRMFDGVAIHPLLRRLAPAVAEHRLPSGPFLRLIAANRQDQELTRYATYDELAAYCNLSANPVGELVLHVFGAATPVRVTLSDSVCTALQLAEHWQDVGEDFRRGRIYLPVEDMERFGVTESDLAAGTASAELKALLTFEIDRARELLDRGVELVRSLSGVAQLAVAGYVGGGRSALAAIEASGYDFLRTAPRATRRSRLAATAQVLLEARR